MNDDLDVLIDGKIVLSIPGDSEKSFTTSLPTGNHSLEVKVSASHDSPTNKKIIIKKDGNLVSADDITYKSKAIGDTVYSTSLTCSDDDTNDDDEDLDNDDLKCTDPCSSDSSTALDIFRECCCCLNDEGFWNTDQCITAAIADLKLSDETYIDMNNPAQVASGKQYLEEVCKAVLADMTSFFYGLGGVANMYGNSSINAGKWNKDKATYNKSISSFTSCLYKFLKETYSDTSIPELSDWATFKAHADSIPGLNSTGKKASVYLTYKWKSLVEFLAPNSFNFILQNDDVVQGLSDILTSDGHACHRFTFQEAVASKTTMGWAIKGMGRNCRAINTEPDSKDIIVNNVSPMIFEGGQFLVTGVDYSKHPPSVTSAKFWSVDKPGESDPSKTFEHIVKEKPEHKALYVAVHEAGHTLDYFNGLKVGREYGFGFDPEWLDIAGWFWNGTYKRYVLDFSNFYYHTQPGPKEAPITLYGHTLPYEDFSEAWSCWIFNPAALSKYCPRRFWYMQNKVMPFLAAHPLTTFKPNRG